MTDQNLLYSHKIQRKWGWKPSLPDHRDWQHKFSTKHLSEDDFPEIIDLSKYLPPVLDQGRIGDCTAHAITECFRSERIKSGLEDFDMARLQLYWDERSIEGTTDSDSGAMIRDGVKSLADKGVAHEALWPCTDDDLYKQPSVNVYVDAQNYKISKFASVDVNPASIMEALNAGHPVMIGISVFDSLESKEVAESGVVPMPGENDKVLGGHAVLLFSSDRNKRMFKIRNSWGENWGDHGNFWAPFDYIGSEKFGSDYWIINGLNSK